MIASHASWRYAWLAAAIAAGLVVAFARGAATTASAPAIELPPANRVRTIAGGDLFDFGDRDGNGDAVRLQHPLGLTRAGGVLFIADTYNHKIKTLNPVTGDVRTFAGSGVEGHEDGAAAVATFYEPGGLSATSDALFVADTNNHAIRRVRLTDGRVETLELSTSSK